MTHLTRPPQQHKQPSRKGKKAWRKNVDITDVQTGLEALRAEVIQGGPIAERESAELFTLDTVGSEDIKKIHRLRKPLRVDEILSQRSAVGAVDSRKRSHSRITDGVIEVTSKKQKEDWVSKKEVQRIREAVQGGSQLTTTLLEEDETPTFDLWSKDLTVETEQGVLSEYIPKKRAKVAPRTLQKAPIAMTASGRPVRAVKDPKSGTSYNPTFEDWDALLTKEGDKEVEAETKRREQAMAEAEREERVAAASLDDVAYHTDADSAWEGFETDNDASESKNKRPTRKTTADRNKIKRRKEAERQARHEQQMANKKKQAVQIEEALKKRNVASLEKLSMEIAEQDLSTSDDDRVVRRRRLGTSTIPEKALEVVLPDELQESLRRLKPEGNLLNDRFRNLLVNGKLESRKPILQPKKKRRTYTEKWSYKDFSVSV